MKFLKKLLSIVPSIPAYAHCDVPCGIYDPKPAQIAAATITKMVEKVEGLPAEREKWSIDDKANFIRYIWTKEEHARKCKEELLILWTDYFKPEHLEIFPNLHKTFWEAAKLCSENKQHVNKESAEKLATVVNEIAEMFAKSKEAAKK